MPDFRSRDFLLDHIGHTMAFYHPRAIDPLGGFFHFFRDDGSVEPARAWISETFDLMERKFWSVDWDYNQDDKSNIFCPWGYSAGTSCRVG